MIAENELACARGLLDRRVAARLQRLLEQLGLPTRLPRSLADDEIIAVCDLDKKVRGGRVNFVLIDDLGAPRRVVDISAAEIAGAMGVLSPG